MFQKGRRSTINEEATQPQFNAYLHCLANFVYLPLFSETYLQQRVTNSVTRKWTHQQRRPSFRTPAGGTTTIFSKANMLLLPDGGDVTRWWPGQTFLKGCNAFLAETSVSFIYETKFVHPTNSRLAQDYNPEGFGNITKRWELPLPSANQHFIWPWFSTSAAEKKRGLHLWYLNVLKFAKIA